MSQNTFSNPGDQSELTIEIFGQEYSFSRLKSGGELTMDAFLQKTTPHPVDAIKPHLDGLPSDDRQYLLNQARLEAKDWPPKFRSKKGVGLILGTEEGQIELLYQGLIIHHPEFTKDGAAKLYRRIEDNPDTGTGIIKKIYACILRLTLPDDEEDIPKAMGSQSSRRLTGSFSSDDANKN